MICGKKRSSVQEKQAFQHTASLKYHVKRGTKIALFQDGWTQVYFCSLCQVFDALKKSKKKVITTIPLETYTNKYHMVGVEEFIDSNNFGKVNCGNEEEGNDDDCMVLFPGEKHMKCHEDVESDSDDKRP